MTLNVYTCEDCGHKMIGVIWRRYCIRCRKFHDIEDMKEYIVHKYNLRLDSNVKRLNYERKCRWTCNTCEYSFLRTCTEILNNNGCEICKLKRELEYEKELYYKFNESGRKQLINRYPLSYGETMVKEFFDEIEIKYIQEYEFKDFKNHPFDFYIPELNLCVEYDGRQHVEPCARQGGVRGLEKRKSNDVLRNEYCRRKKISLVRLTFMDTDETNKEIVEKAMINIFEKNIVVFVGYNINVERIELDVNDHQNSRTEKIINSISFNFKNSCQIL